jgi:hypothetical protein
VASLAEHLTGVRILLLVTYRPSISRAWQASLMPADHDGCWAIQIRRYSGVTRHSRGLRNSRSLLASRVLGTALPGCISFGRDARAIHEQAEAGMVLSREQGCPLFLAVGAIVRSWGLAQPGRVWREAPRYSRA